MCVQNRQKRWVAYLSQAVALCLLFTGLRAHAICLFVDGHTKQTLTISPTNVTRSPAENGAESLTYTLSSADIAAAWGIPTTTAIIACSTNETLTIGNSGFTPVGSGSNYLATNVSGIQYNSHSGIWTYPNSGANATMSLSNTSVTPNMLTTGSSTVGNIVITQKTEGRMSQGGTVNAGKLFTITTSTGLEILDVYANSFTVTVPTCAVNSYDASVDLGAAYSNKMKSVGTTTNGTPFVINMTCASATLSPTITFSADADSEHATVIKNQGSASGVGVQLLYGGAVITPNQSTTLGAAATTAAKNYDFTAQLYQLADTVGAGSIETSATFTLDYE